MQIYSREQIRAWDEYTMKHEPISSPDLMERAARACYDWLREHGLEKRAFTFYCSKGNNGGDGLALARLLSATARRVSVYILEFGTMGTPEFQANLVKLHQTNAEIKYISTAETIAGLGTGDIVIDALLGTGINRAIDGLTAHLIDHINHSGNEIISIDIPSGLYPDRSSLRNKVVQASHTLSFQCFKLAFLVAENEKFFGQVHILDIGLHPGFPPTVTPAFELIDNEMAAGLLKPRKKFSHKGDYGHVALFAGSRGMMGAAILCARAVVRSGAGKLTCHIPGAGNDIMQLGVPEAMTMTGGDDYIVSAGDLENYQSIGIGPGIGRHDTHRALLSTLFRSGKPMVIDADALNTIAAEPSLFNEIIPGSIITPHPGEFKKLFGKTENDFDSIQVALQKSAQLGIYIVLKGARTFIAMPDGKGSFNSSGNPGMAKGGSGDVLTGIIAGLLGQKYEPAEAAKLGVYLHGLAGDFAALRYSQSSMTANDLVEHLGDAYNAISASGSIIH